MKAVIPVLLPVDQDPPSILGSTLESSTARSIMQSRKMARTGPSWGMLAVLVLFSCSAPDLPHSTGTTQSASHNADWSIFTLGPNDRVHLVVMGHPEMSGPPEGLRISPDGTLGVPLAGAVPIQGMMPKDAALAIKAALAKSLRNPDVTLAVIEYESRQYFLLGAIDDPGPKTFNRPTTALEAASQGGKVLTGARRTQSVIIRRHSQEDIEVIPFNMDTPGYNGYVQIRPGDMIFIPRSGADRFREEATPYLQGIGLTLAQIASLALAYDRLYNDD